MPKRTIDQRSKRENMMNSDHKATNDTYRKRYDQIKWDSAKKDGKSDK